MNRDIKCKHFIDTYDANNSPVIGCNNKCIVVHCHKLYKTSDKFKPICPYNYTLDAQLYCKGFESSAKHKVVYEDGVDVWAIIEKDTYEKCEDFINSLKIIEVE